MVVPVYVPEVFTAESAERRGTNHRGTEGTEGKQHREDRRH
jgi:hypothetical protein